MVKEKFTLKRFREDVKDHKIQILHDDGVYRHLRFKKQGTINYSFELVTYPNHLVISGDMGCYVFSRQTHDMFRFFASDRLNDPISINPHYWTEKLQACSLFGSCQDSYYPWKYFDYEASLESILDYIEDHKQHQHILKDLNDCEETSGAIINVLKTYGLTDGYDYLVFSYSFHVLWCMYAIVWGIQKYRVYTFVDDSSKRIKVGATYTPKIKGRGAFDYLVIDVGDKFAICRTDFSICKQIVSVEELLNEYEEVHNETN